MVQEFCKNNEVDYEIFEMPAPKFGGSFGGGALAGPGFALDGGGGGLFGAPSVSMFSSSSYIAPKVFSKPRKTKATAHLFGGGSALPYFAAGYKAPEIKP